MCGFSAVYRYTDGDRVSAAELDRMQARMECRGPDGEGRWCRDDGRVALTHRRLAIIDLSGRAAQPMQSHTAPHVITFNGEIYNYRELRSGLEARGCRFVTGSDTEVILHLYAEKGPDLVDDLQGMFAFALWDGAKRGLLLARDPFGVKPLYYADNGSCIRVASEVKALVATGAVDTSPSAAGRAGFFLWGSVPEPFTFFRGVRALPAGNIMWIEDGKAPQLRQYANVADLFRTPHADPGSPQAAELLRVAMNESVQRHLVSDVDVGVFLSSGIDSTTLAAIASRHGGALRTTTLAFEEYRNTASDEAPLAEAVARSCGARHETVWVNRNDFASARERLIDRMDQPSVDGVNTYFVAHAAASTGLKVALSGAGADELFGGYSLFRTLPRLVNAIRRVPLAAPVGRVARQLLAPLVSRVTSPKYASILELGGSWVGAYLLARSLYLPWELPKVLGDDMAHAGLKELAPTESLHARIAGISGERATVSVLEASGYLRNQLLRDADWASMSHSLELRVPYVDWTLWKAIAPLISSGSARIDKAALASLAQSLPDAVRQRPKSGFQVPVRQWLQADRDQRYSDRGLRGWARYIYDRAS